MHHSAGLHREIAPTLPAPERLQLAGRSLGNTLRLARGTADAVRPPLSDKPDLGGSLIGKGIYPRRTRHRERRAAPPGM